MSQLHERLRALIDQRDGRTIYELAMSEHLVDGVVEQVKDGWAQVALSNGFHVGVRLGDDDVPFGEGEQVSVLDDRGRSLGLIDSASRVHGYRTPFEQVAEAVARLAESDRRNRERIDAERDERVALYKTLPPSLRAVVDGWIETDPAIIGDHLHYDLVALAIGVAVMRFATERAPESRHLAAAWLRATSDEAESCNRKMLDEAIEAAGPGCSSNQAQYGIAVAGAMLRGEDLTGLVPAMALLVGWPPASSLRAEGDHA